MHVHVHGDVGEFSTLGRRVGPQSFVIDSAKIMLSNAKKVLKNYSSAGFKT